MLNIVLIVSNQLYKNVYLLHSCYVLKEESVVCISDDGFSLLFMLPAQSGFNGIALLIDNVAS